VTPKGDIWREHSPPYLLLAEFPRLGGERKHAYVDTAPRLRRCEAEYRVVYEEIILRGYLGDVLFVEESSQRTHERQVIAGLGMHFSNIGSSQSHAKSAGEHVHTHITVLVREDIDSCGGELVLQCLGKYREEVLSPS
jgi:hypothetical protein